MVAIAWLLKIIHIRLVFVKLCQNIVAIQFLSHGVDKSVTWYVRLLASCLADTKLHCVVTEAHRLN